MTEIYLILGLQVRGHVWIREGVCIRTDAHPALRWAKGRTWLAIERWVLSQGYTLEKVNEY